MCTVSPTAGLPFHIDSPRSPMLCAVLYVSKKYRGSYIYLYHSIEYLLCLPLAMLGLDTTLLPSGPLAGTVFSFHTLIFLGAVQCEAFSLRGCISFPCIFSWLNESLLITTLIAPASRLYPLLPCSSSTMHAF